MAVPAGSHYSTNKVKKEGKRMNRGYLVPQPSPPLPPRVRKEIKAIMDKYKLNRSLRRELLLGELREIDEKTEIEMLPSRIKELIAEVETLKTSIKAVAVIACVYVIDKFAAVFK